MSQSAVLGWIVMLTSLDMIQGSIHHRYLLCSEIVWDYASGGEDLISFSNSRADDYISQKTERIGRRYVKATYVEYADNYYMDILEKDASVPVGLLGPTIDVTVGDTLVVTVKSNLTNGRNCSFHLDAPFRQISATDQRNRIRVTSWLIGDLSGPSMTSLEPCTVWIYYSNTDSNKDMHSGLIGPLKVYNKSRRKVDMGRIALSAILLFAVIDENLSWYLESNIRRYCPVGCDNNTDDAFIRSNRMHGINGYSYGHLPHLAIPTDVVIRWHLVTLPTLWRVYTVRLNGHRLSYNGRTVYSVDLYPRESVTVTLRPTCVGRWLLSTTDSSLTEGGMSALLEVIPNYDKPFSPSVYTGIRRYYIAVKDQHSIHYGTEAKFVIYKDLTFTAMSHETRLYGEVGDVIKVVFVNRAMRNYSLCVIGLTVDKYSEGLHYNNSHTDYHSVMPGAMSTYYWQIDDWTTTGSRDSDCISASYSTSEAGEGGVTPVGIIMVCRNVRGPRKMLTSDVSQAQNNKQLWLTIGNERNSSELNNVTNVKERCYGDQVIVHLVSLRTHGDPDVVVALGHQWMVDKTDVRAIVVSPLSSRSASLRLGKHGDVTIRTTSGYGFTQVLYRLRTLDCESSRSSGSPPTLEAAPARHGDGDHRVVEVYLAVDAIGWTYGSSHTYKKALFVRYKDDTFKRLYPTTNDANLDLGIVGPTIRVSVGSRLVIHLQNRVRGDTRFNFVILGRERGVRKLDTDHDDPENGVPARQVRTFSWFIDDSFITSNLPCTTHAYASDVNGHGDIDAGLIGHLVVCRSSEDSPSIAVVMADFDERKSSINVPDQLPGYTPVPSLNGYSRDLVGPSFALNSKVTWHIISASARLKWLKFTANTVTSDSPISPTSLVQPLFPYQTLTVVTTASHGDIWGVDCNRYDTSCYRIRCSTL